MWKVKITTDQKFRKSFYISNKYEQDSKLKEIELRKLNLSEKWNFSW